VLPSFWQIRFRIAPESTWALWITARYRAAGNRVYKAPAINPPLISTNYRCWNKCRQSQIKSKIMFDLCELVRQTDAVCTACVLLIYCNLLANYPDYSFRWETLQPCQGFPCFTWFLWVFYIWYKRGGWSKCSDIDRGTLSLTILLLVASWVLFGHAEFSKELWDY